MVSQGLFDAFYLSVLVLGFQKHNPHGFAVTTL